MSAPLSIKPSASGEAIRRAAIEDLAQRAPSQSEPHPDWIEQVLDAYEEQYDFPPQGRSHMRDCLAMMSEPAAVPQSEPLPSKPVGLIEDAIDALRHAEYKSGMHRDEPKAQYAEQCAQGLRDAINRAVAARDAGEQS